MLWPRRLHGNGVVKPELDWSAPLDLNGLQSKIIRPALEAIGLPASRPERTDADGTVVPATKGVRLHDLRHTAATLWLTAALTTYADYIPEQEAENPLLNPLPRDQRPT